MRQLGVWAEKSVEGRCYILSIPRATVETRMFYARKMLAELVHEI
jgi:DNA-directed RNA polymerase specialized sigma24 family protein